MTALRWMLGFVLFAGMCAASSPAQEKQATLTPVKYDGLKQEILKQRGKVVVVDFWAINCPPCRKALPDYIKLQNEYAKQGLVVITVSVDPMEKFKRANEILTEIQSPLKNLLLDEPTEVWTQKFDFKSLPFAYVFDRRGKWVRYRSVDFADSEAYDAAVKKGVMQILNEK